MSDYKVIKEFGCVEVGDMFCYDDANEVYTSSYTNANDTIINTREMVLVPSIVDILVKEGYLKEIKATPVTTPEKNKLNTISEFVYKQIENCKKTNTEVAKAYEEGKMQSCVKVESDTVHYNLLKVLNHIKDLINE